MLKLSAAYGATWSSAFGHRDLHYNERLWTPVEESHSPEDIIFGLMDKSDGSAFVIRIEAVEGLEEVEDEAIEATLAESVSDPKFNAVEVRKWTKAISGHQFNVIEYHISNPKFGDQVLCHAYARDGEDVIMLVLSWPRALPRRGAEFPIKQLSLLEGMSLVIKAN